MKTVTALDQGWVDALRAAGLTVKLDDGWLTRRRPASTGHLAATGQLNHHTGSKSLGQSSARWMFRDGRPDLPPPLCHGSVDKDGVVYIGAAGRANHAGKAKASGPMPAGDGNTIYLGWEHQNTGTEGWPKAQYESMVILNAVTALHFGWPADHSRAHKETSVTGKWDPGALFMPRFRDDIAAAMRGTKEPKMNPVQLGHVDLALAISATSKAIDHFDDAKKSRLVVWRQIATLKTARAGLVLAAKLMPPK